MRDRIYEFDEIDDEMSTVIERLWDMLKVVRENYYHPEFHGSLSIKSVVPAVVPDLDYSALRIGDGGSAAAAFQRRVEGNTSGAEWEGVGSDLRTYCGMDTMAMVRLSQVLRDAANS
jgi:hypothetical protein